MQFFAFLIAECLYSIRDLFARKGSEGAPRRSPGQGILSLAMVGLLVAIVVEIVVGSALVAIVFTLAGLLAVIAATLII